MASKNGTSWDLMFELADFHGQVVMSKEAEHDFWHLLNHVLDMEEGKPMDEATKKWLPGFVKRWGEARAGV